MMFFCIYSCLSSTNVSFIRQFFSVLITPEHCTSAFGKTDYAILGTANQSISLLSFAFRAQLYNDRDVFYPASVCGTQFHETTYCGT
jgi:hypothetical protein